VRWAFVGNMHESPIRRATLTNRPTSPFACTARTCPGLPVDAPGQATPLVSAHGRVEQPIRVHAVLPAPVYDEIELSITTEVAGPADLEVRREELMKL
jgi:hypothetical protein